MGSPLTITATCAWAGSDDPTIKVRAKLQPRMNVESRLRKATVMVILAMLVQSLVK
jgi:hypothetical protein